MYVCVCVCVCVVCVCVCWWWGKKVLGEHADASAAGEGKGLANSELGPHHYTLLRLKCFGDNWGHYTVWLTC
jgi:hypothetical protein